MRLFLQFCQLVERSPAWFFEAGEPVANVCADPDDVVRIPYLDVVVSAGSGRINDVVRALDNLPWPRSMIAPMGNPREIQCMHCAGDSMEPGILDGALVFLRRTDDKLIKTSRRIPPIYVVLVGADARVKRVSSPTAKTRALISDNPTYPVEVLEMARVSILGPVVGWLNRPL
jgi:phage repressor protein C with HTH and peptisase S24 domain